MKVAKTGLTLLAIAALIGCSPTSYVDNNDGPNAQQDQADDRYESAKPVIEDSSSMTPAGDQTAEIEEQPKDVVDTAVADGNFSTLAAALKAGDLIDTLKSEGPFTVFAPTDEAFSKLPEGTLDHLLKPENKEQLVAILTYHVVPGKVDSTAVASLDSATTVNGAEIAIDVSSDGVKVGNAMVTTADIACSNGMIHVVDTVLLPPDTEKNESSHEGETLSVEGVGSFKTLFAAIEAAGLKETLDKDGPFTIFAPTDEAFAALPEGTIEELLKPENKSQLVSILTFHVVAGEVPSGKVVEMTSATTVNGADLAIESADGAVRVNGATVLKTDVPCEVGLIHAIDKVLMP